MKLSLLTLSGFLGTVTLGQNVNTFVQVGFKKPFFKFFRNKLSVILRLILKNPVGCWLDQMMGQSKSFKLMFKWIVSKR
jgi:hypothetical protein